ncbi:Uncharacterised protein [Escherichia coli]|nr:Uncharacterised protein [Escherichia coli]
MSTRNIHVNTASYTLLVAGKKKNTGEEWDVLEFSSLTELKKYRKSHPEKMAFSYSYALSQGVDKQFRISTLRKPITSNSSCVRLSVPASISGRSADRM